MSEDYGLSVTNNGKTLNLTSDDIVSLSYIQTISENDGTDVDLTQFSTAANGWASYIEGAGEADISMYYTANTSAKRLGLQDNTMNKDNIFMSVSSHVTSLDGIVLEPWAMRGGFCIYDEDTNDIYSKGGSVTCFCGATK